MPSIKILGYNLFFWSNEYAGGDLEPVHIHVCRGEQKKDAPKWWVGYGKRISRADDGGNYERFGLKESDIRQIEEIIRDNSLTIIEMWMEHFGDEGITFHESVCQQ